LHLKRFHCEELVNAAYDVVPRGYCKKVKIMKPTAVDASEELIGKRFNEVIAPQTVDIPVIFELFLRSGYMHGIWILLNRSRNTRFIVRYEAWLQPDRLIECNMELLGAGA
jgi:hypothetical protein